jgi:hypothetical protein
LNRLAAYLHKELIGLPIVPVDAWYGSIVARPGKVMCIGPNYRDHAAESDLELPREPLIYMYDSNTVVGPYDNLLLPGGSSQTDWEVERDLPDTPASVKAFCLPSTAHGGQDVAAGRRNRNPCQQGSNPQAVSRRGSIWWHSRVGWRWQDP